MRLFIQIWMLLAILLVERNFVKAQGDPDLVFAEGSGVIDDEDYVTDAPGELGEQGSGATEGTPVHIRTSGVVVAKPKFDNTIRINKIGDKKAVFEPAHADPKSRQSLEVFDTVCAVLLASLRTNELTSQAEDCVGVSITDGSLVVTTEITFSEDTTAVASDVESAIKSTLAGNTLSDSTTSLTVDKRSIRVTPTGSDAVDVSTVKPTKKPGKPNKSNPTPDMPTSVSPDNNNGLTDNEIFFDTSPPMKPVMSTTMSNEIGNNVHNNKLEVKDKKEKQGFFKMVLGSPVLLAALVGAVVLTLITIVLITMFLIYRVKKKDEGSYSLDEPHKVKDPTAYWKDTKEFYA
ncbi:syndecan-3-like [Asterias rubens]|uniref:syndecan-3-like n=1 Tax=Asterias rubens TaxID=7604 RepID=UPI00145537C9|nr:syndecan-3-like [Asterias rubens]